MPAIRATVTAASLNVRPAPNTSQSPAGVLPRGTSVEVLERHGRWFRVRANELTGFVHGDFLRLENGAPVPPFLCESEPLCDAALEAPSSQQLEGLDLGGIRRMTAQTWNRYGGLLNLLSGVVGIRPAAAVAVLCVESGGRAFGDDGRMIIRFENHIFWDQWGRFHPDAFREHFRFAGGRRWTGHRFREQRTGAWETLHTGQRNEWRALAVARGLHEAAALRSISMGAPQIMGFNHARIGYDSVQRMFDQMTRDERFHILALFDFIRGPGATSRMLEALRREQYVNFATGYNGAGQAPVYGERIRAHVDAFDQVCRVAGLELGGGQPVYA